RRFGMNARDLADQLVHEPVVDSCDAKASAAFVECSMLQAEDYAQQVEQQWDVAVSAYCLDEVREPCPRSILFTFFHFNDVRRRWPHRLPDIRFLAVMLDPSLAKSLDARRSHSRPVRVILAETSADRARDAMADLISLLPPERFSIAAKVTRRPELLLAR